MKEVNPCSIVQRVIDNPKGIIIGALGGIYYVHKKQISGSHAALTILGFAVVGIIINDILSNIPHSPAMVNDFSNPVQPNK